jgi:hypothetical protein
VTIVGAVLVVAVVIAVISYLRKHLKRLEARAERAYPGPLDGQPVPSSAR